MRISIHNKIQGKPVKVMGLDGRVHLEQNGKIVNLGWGWDNIDEDWDTVFNLITIDGCAIAPYLSSENRKADTFVSHSLALVDIDKGMTIPQLFDHPFYNEYGAGFYTTPSHTDDDPRFRIIHRFETEITDLHKMRKVYRALKLVYGDADVSCKDAARLFYGTIDCQIKEFRQNLLTDVAVECLIDAIDNYDRKNFKNPSGETPHVELTDKRKQEILDLLHSSYVGQYEIWRNIGWGLKNSGFMLSDYQWVTTGMMSQKSPSDARKVWESESRGEITMGSIIYFLRSRYGADLFTMKSKVEQSADNLYNKYCTDK